MNPKRPKIKTRLKSWTKKQNLLSLWNVQKFSPIGQSLSLKCESKHADWKKKFNHWFNTAVGIGSWYDFQIIVLYNTNYSRLRTLINDQQNPKYKS